MQYGDGELEKNLGRVLQKLKPADVAVGTKVRLPPGEFGRIDDAVRISLEGSLARLHLDRVDILHLHNPITENGGGSALGVRQVLDDLVPAFERLREQGRLFPRDDGRRRHGGAASGDRCWCLRQRAGRLQHAQSVCRGRVAAELSGTGLWEVVRSTKAAGVGVVGIRVLAGGALSGSAERHPIAGPAPEPIGSAMSYAADTYARAA